MKKNVANLLIAFFISITVANSQIQVGSGTTTQSNLPINTNWGYNYTQQIYLASEISVSGTITSVSFYLSGGATTNSNSWTIYMGHTSKSSFASTTDWVPLSGLTNVFSGNVTFPAVGNWMTVTLSTPFSYNGTDNLVVAIDENTASFASSSATWQNSTTTSSTGIYYRNDTTNPNPSTPPTATGITTGRANIILGGISFPVCIAPTGQASSLNFTSTSSTSTDASFTAATPAPSGYLVVRSNSATPPTLTDGTVYTVGSTALGAGTLVIANGTSTSFTSSTLNSNTLYYYYIFSYNNTGCSGGPKYNMSSPLSGALTTCPASPTLPTATAITSTGATIGWSASVAGGGAANINYTVEVYSNSAYTLPITGSPFSAGTSVSQNIAGLSGFTTYYYRIKANNGSCDSGYLTGNFTTFKSEPTNQITNLSASSVTTSAIPLTWTAAVAGSQLPDGYLVKASNTSLGTITNPTDGTDPADVTAFTGGLANKKQTTGTVTSTTSFTGMTAGTMYYYKVYSYTNSGTLIDFKIDNPAVLNHATLPNAATLPVFSATTASGTTLSWTVPSGYDAAKHTMLVFVKATSAVTAGTPTSDPLSYTANTIFGSGTAYQGDAAAYCVYAGDGNSVSISGLNGNTTYHIRIVSVVDEANSNGTRSYSAGLTGNVLTSKTEPTNQVTNLSASSVTTSAIPLTWTAAVAGSQLPDGYLVKASNTSLGTITNPTDGTDPADVTAFTGGLANKKQTTGTVTSTTSFTGMTAGTMYYYKVYSYTNSGTSIDFKIDNPAVLNHATLPNAATLPVFSATTASGTTLSWTVPSGYDAAKHTMLVFVKATSAVTAGTPTSDPLSYTANTVFGSGTAYQGDAAAYCVYAGDGNSVSISGLSANTTYHIRIVSVVDEANSNGTRSYSAGLTGNVLTSKTEPTNQVTNLSASSVTTSAIPLTWTAAVAGSQLPDGYLVKASNTSLGTITNPTDGTDPADVTAFTGGLANKKQTTGTVTSTTSFTGMTAGTMYYYKVYSYTNSGTSIDFKIDNPAVLNHATLPNAATLPVFSATTASGTTLSWTVPSGYDAAKHTMLVFVKATSAVTAGTPTSDPLSYTANTVFGSGTAYQGDAAAYCVYAGDGNSVSISGLNGNTTYHIWIVSVVDEANSNGTRSYSAGLAGNKTTLCNPTSSFNLTFEDSSNLPTCTSFISTDTLGANINTANPYQGIRCLGLQTTNTIYVLPLTNNIHLNTHFINLYARTFSGTGQLGIGYLTNPTDSSTYTNLYTCSLTTTYQYFSYVPENIPENSYVALKLISSSGAFRIDNIVWEQKPNIVWSNQAWSNVTGPTLYDNAIISDNLTTGTDLICRDLTINSSYTLTIAANNKLSVKGNLVNNGSIVFKSDSSGSASFDTYTGIAVNGSVTVERFIPAKRAFRFLTSSVTTTTNINSNWQENGSTTTGLGTHITGVGGSSNGFDTTANNNPSLFTFNHTSAAWEAVTSTITNTLTAGTAYRLLVRGDRTTDLTSNTPIATNTVLRATGILKTGDFTPVLNQAAEGYSFVGNPYQAPVDIKTVLQNSSINMNTDILYYWDPTLNSRGGYVVRTLGVNLNNVTSNFNEFLQPGQAVFVKKANTTSPASMTFTESHKAIANASPGVFRTANSSQNVGAIKVNLATSINSEWTLIEGALALFNSSFEASVNEEDAIKMANLDEEVSFVVNNTSLAIASQPIATAVDELPLKLINTRHTNYQWKFELINYDGPTPYLLDTQNNTYTLIENNSIVPFTVNGQENSRFKILFQNPTLNISDLSQKIVLYPNPASSGSSGFFLQGISDVSIDLYNVLGQKIPVQMISNENVIQIIPEGELVKGVYLVSITKEGKKSQVKWIVE